MTQMPSFDYRGLKCPLPVLKARRALAQMVAGDAVDAQVPVVLPDGRPLGPARGGEGLGCVAAVAAFPLAPPHLAKLLVKELVLPGDSVAARAPLLADLRVTGEAVQPAHVLESGSAAVVDQLTIGLGVLEGCAQPGDPDQGQGGRKEPVLRLRSTCRRRSSHSG